MTNQEYDRENAKINLNKLRTNFEQIEYNFDANIKSSATSSLASVGSSKLRPHLHNKGKAPQPPKSLESSIFESTRCEQNVLREKYKIKETDI